MKIGTAVLAVLSAASAYGAEGFGVPRTFVAQRSSLTSLAMSTKEKEATDEKKKDAPPVNIGWDSHKAVVRSCYSSVYLAKRVSCVGLGCKCISLERFSALCPVALIGLPG